MKKGSTHILRLAVVALGLVVITLCIYVLSLLINDEAGMYSPILLGMYITTLPFYFALYQTLKLLGYVDKKQAFSLTTVTALKKIKHCALVISGLYALVMPYVYIVADRDDAPGVVAIGLVLVGSSFVIAISAGVLQKLIENAVALKSENDLTV